MLKTYNYDFHVFCHLENPKEGVSMVAQLTSPLPCDACIPHSCQFMSLLLHFQPSSLFIAWTSSRGWPKSFMGDPVEAPGSHYGSAQLSPLQPATEWTSGWKTLSISSLCKIFWMKKKKSFRKKSALKRRELSAWECLAHSHPTVSGVQLHW